MFSNSEISFETKSKAGILALIVVKDMAIAPNAGIKRTAETARSVIKGIIETVDAFIKTNNVEITTTAITEITSKNNLGIAFKKKTMR